MPPVWKRADHSVYCVCVCFYVNVYKFLCVLLSLSILRVGCGICLIITFLFTLNCTTYIFSANNGSCLTNTFENNVSLTNDVVTFEQPGRGFLCHGS